jgi:hypothetical protein
LAVAALAAAVLIVALLSASLALGQRGGARQPAAPPASEAQLTRSVRAYYALLPANPRAAWGLLSPRAHRQLGGELAFTGYWRGVSRLRVLGSTATPADQAVRSRLWLQNADGRARALSQRLVLVPGAGGRWLIDKFGD